MKRIIIVEDDPAMLEIVSIDLKTSGYSVTTFSDGEMILKNDFLIPDIFILDRQLSGVGGLDICKHLKSMKKTANIPVIMVSASRDIHAMAKDAKADGALEKPFTMSALRDMVESLL